MFPWVISNFSVPIIDLLSWFSPNVCWFERIGGLFCSFGDKRPIPIDIFDVESADCIDSSEKPSWRAALDLFFLATDWPTSIAFGLYVGDIQGIFDKFAWGFRVDRGHIRQLIFGNNWVGNSISFEVAALGLSSLNVISPQVTGSNIPILHDVRVGDGLNIGRVSIVLSPDLLGDLLPWMCPGDILFLEGWLSGVMSWLTRCFLVEGGIPIVARNIVSSRCGKLQL